MSAYYNDKKQTEQLKNFLKPKNPPPALPKGLEKSERTLPVRGSK